MLCLNVDMYLRDRDDNLAEMSSLDCVRLPPGYYSPAGDNAYYQCSSPYALPPQLQVFTTRGNGIDDCAVFPHLQAFLQPVPGDALASPLRPPLTAEAWVEWGNTVGQPIAIVGTTPYWHLSVKLAASPTGNGSELATDLYLVDAAQGAAVTAVLPWVRRDRWHHVAAVCSEDGCCYFLDGTGFGCGPWLNRTTVAPEEPPLHTSAPAVFVGGTRGNETAGFPPGFLDGKLDEVRLHDHALRPPQLGFHLTDRALASSCTAPDELCGGRCVAGCQGDAQLDRISCSCACAQGESLDLVSGRCLPSCGVGMVATSAEACGCNTSGVKVWRGRYLGISSPSMQPDFARHSWHHRAERIGLAEVRLFDAQLQQVAVSACIEVDLTGKSATTSTCGALYDGTAAGVGALYLSEGLGAMRVMLDLGANVALSRIEITNYNEPLHTSQGARELQLFLAADGDDSALTEASVFQPGHLILEEARLDAAPITGAINTTVLDDRASSPSRSAGLSCAACVANSSGSLLPRSSVHDCICLATHYKEWRHERGRCLARLPGLLPPVSNISNHSSFEGVVAPGTILLIGAPSTDAAAETPTTVCLTLNVERGVANAGQAPDERESQCGTSLQLDLSQPARFYTVRAITSHRMHLPSDELHLTLHTKVALPLPNLSQPGGPLLAYPLAVRLTANVTAEDPADSVSVVFRYAMDGANVNSSSPQLPASGLVLSRNTTLRVRAFHPLYFASAEATQFYHVLLPSRSRPLLPLALQPAGPREVPMGAQVQLASIGPGEVRYRFAAPAHPDPCGEPADEFEAALADGAWSRYGGTLTLSLQHGPEVVLCVYVHEYGRIPSAVESALLQVRPWTQPVRIMALEPPDGLPTVTVMLSSPEGAVVWYALEAINGSALCEAKAMAARVAPNLTLAANGAWAEAMQEQAAITLTRVLPGMRPT